MLRKAKIAFNYGVLILLASMFASGCRQVSLSAGFVFILSLIVPSILLATGKLKVPLITGISYTSSIGFSIVGFIALAFGMFGLLANSGFLENACIGIDLGTRLALKMFAYAAKGL